MDRFVNKKIEKQTIYEIYRACRLCGAGGGYKMPIIQNVVNLDNCDVELKQKIRECVQIEVHQDDKMPPLICELCVDKVNDFYEFLEMCRQTNKRTRLKLGLPPQMLPRGAPDAGDCILGVTEPIFVNDEDSNEPLADKRNKAGGKLKKGGEKWKDVKAKVEKMPSRESRTSRSRPRSPSPLRLRGSRRSDPDSMTLSKLQSKRKKSESPPPKSILKKGKKPEPSGQSPGTRFKRSREPEVKNDSPPKRVKISLKPVSMTPKVSPRQKARDEARQRQRQREAEAEAARRAKEQQTPCEVCGGVYKTMQAMLSHRRSHIVTYTSPKLACTPCAAWFTSEAEASLHHARHSAHRPYRCRRCSHSYTTLRAYDDHVEKGKCLEWEEVPDVRCEECWRTFPTRPLMDRHRCPGESARPAKCTKCGKVYSTKKSLASHTRRCKKGEVVIPSKLLRRLKPLQVRVARCDPILVRGRAEHYNVAGVPANYGLDNTCVYPYLTPGLRIKTEPNDCMVKINDLDFGSYVHWDSEDSGDSDAEDNLDSFHIGFNRQRKISSLTACALKTIFSNKLLGKVPRKYRRLKIESVIESALNDSLSDLNLNDSDTVNDKVSDKGVKFDDEDDLFPKINNETVTNNDFDSLFNVKTDSGDGDELVDKNSDDHVGSKNINMDNGAKEGLENIDSSNEMTNSSVDAESTIEAEDNNVTEKSQDTDMSENLSQDTNDCEQESLKTDLNGDDKDIMEDEKNHSQDDKEITDNDKKIIEDDEQRIMENDEKITDNDKKITEDDEKRITEDHEEKITDSDRKITEDDEMRIMEGDEEKITDSDRKITEDDEMRIMEGDEEKITDSDKKITGDDEMRIMEGDEEKITDSDKKIIEDDEKRIMDDETEASETPVENHKDRGNGIDLDEEKESCKSETDIERQTREDIKSKPEIEYRNEKDESKRKENIENEKDLKSIVNGDDIDDINMNDLEDMSGTEYDDCELMAEIDAQIGEKKGEVEKETDRRENEETDVEKKDVDVERIGETTEVNEKELIENKKDMLDLSKKDNNSMDLDSISDEEFDFND